MSIFFTSDLHFGHKNIINFENGRHFSTIDEHDQTLINNWNKVIKKGDVVYVLGDVSLPCNKETLEKTLPKLNGAKHLILGNHDKLKVHQIFLKNNTWQSIRDYHRLKIEYEGKSYVIILSHFPILEFDQAYKPWCFHLYGHIHNMVNYDSLYKELGFKALHIGVDTSDKYPNTDIYTPIKLDNIIQRLNEIFKIN